MCDEGGAKRQGQGAEQRELAWTRTLPGDRGGSSRLSPAPVYLTFQTYFAGCDTSIGFAFPYW